MYVVKFNMYTTGKAGDRRELYKGVCFATLKEAYDYIENEWVNDVSLWTEWLKPDLIFKRRKIYNYNYRSEITYRIDKLEINENPDFVIERTFFISFYGNKMRNKDDYGIGDSLMLHKDIPLECTNNRYSNTIFYRIVNDVLVKIEENDE